MIYKWQYLNNIKTKLTLLRTILTLFNTLEIFKMQFNIQKLVQVPYFLIKMI